jgi:hypothetical protein
MAVQAGIAATMALLGKKQMDAQKGAMNEQEMAAQKAKAAQNLASKKNANYSDILNNITGKAPGAGGTSLTGPAGVSTIPLATSTALGA